MIDEEFLNKKTKEMSGKLGEFSKNIGNESKENKEFAAKVFSDFNRFSKRGIEGMKEGKAYFERLQQEINKK